MFARTQFRMRAFRRFARARRGSAAVEFAFVLMPFFLLTFGLAEVAMIGFAQTSLDFAVSETGRQIRTGQAQMNGVSEAQIKAQLCDEINNFIVMGCDGNLYLDVRRFNSFTDANNNALNSVQNNNFSAAGMGFQPGDPSDIVVVRAYYRWKVITPLFEPIFENVSGGQRILVSTMMFRNEPFATGS
jgi:Flp pilus assembly protein TadG